ncbi:hypothetical protein V7S76_01335 [Aquirufa sp. ROCK2-A2]
MKKTTQLCLFLFALLAFSFASNAQTSKKGSLIGLHSGTLKLAPNVTMKQYVDFFHNSLQPQLEKEFQCKLILVQGVRGKGQNQIGFIWLFESDAARNKVYKSEGVYTPFGQNAMNKVQKTLDAWNKLGTSETTYTDWSVL